MSAFSGICTNSKNRTKQFNINAEIQHTLSNIWRLNYGIKSSLKNYDYNQELEDATKNDFTNSILNAFAESRVHISTNFVLTSGVNVSTYLNKSSDVFLSPRIKINYNHGFFSTWVDYANTLQFEERMNIFTVQSPVDIWLPVKNQSPLKSDQVSIGSKIKFNEKLSVSLGVYYKNLKNIKEFGSFNRVDLSESIGKMISGSGNAIGGELDFEFNTRFVYSRFNYTLSHVKAKFEEINNGEYFDPAYDVRHNILCNASLRISKKVNVNLLWTYKSGVTATVPAGVAVAKDIGANKSAFIPIYLERYNYRMPPTHRLDINLEYLKKIKGNLLKINIGAYNLYNQQNPSFVFVQAKAKDDYFLRFILNSEVIFPFMPYFSVSYSFSKKKK